jgi:predicted Zn-dependent peptidase
VQRVFEEIETVRTTTLSPNQVARVRESLLRDFERNSEDNGYLLGQILRRYTDGSLANGAAVDSEPDQIAALTGVAIQQAAETYLNTGHYVKVTLMPETK